MYYSSGTRSSHCHHHGVCGVPGCHGDPGCLPNPFHSPPRWKYKRRGQRGQWPMGRLCADHHCQPNGGDDSTFIEMWSKWRMFLTCFSFVFAVLWISYGHLCRHRGWGGGRRRGGGDARRRQRRSANHHQEGGQRWRRPSLLSHVHLCGSSHGNHKSAHQSHTSILLMSTTADTRDQRNVCLHTLTHNTVIHLTLIAICDL